MSTEERLARPRQTRPGTRWAVAPSVGTEVDRRVTGIHHADLDCPAVARWTEEHSLLGHEFIEVDAHTGDVVSTWAQTSGTRVAAWVLQPTYSAERLDPSTWRACLRCGSTTSQAAVIACPQCHLTACDCAD